MEREYYPCTPSPDCPQRLKGGCREDSHHYYPVEEKMTRIMRIFRNLPENLVETCRRFHTEVLDKNHKEYPDNETMKQAIIDADLAGEICLSATKRRAVYGR